MGHVIRDDGCGELEEAGGGVDVVADVSSIEQKLSVCARGGGGFRGNFAVPAPLLFARFFSRAFFRAHLYVPRCS